MTTHPTLCLIIPSEPRHTDLAGGLLRVFCAALGFPPGETARIELAAVEAINNAIEHAYGGRAGSEVAIQARIEDACLWIEVRDQGIALRVPPEGVMPDPWDEHSRGWPLLRACMDRVEYRSDEAGNLLILGKRLPAPE